MRILLTNDDGILAPGIAAMYSALAAIDGFDVAVAAPDTVQSASGHGITIGQPLVARKVYANNAFHGYAVSGRPADCVKLAVNQLLEERPELVVSGINDGSNVAVNVLYSGTVAAAAEGAILGIPAVAVSLEWGDAMNFDGAAKIAARLIKCFADRVKAGDPPCPLLNINIPDKVSERSPGIRVVPQASQRVNEHYESHDTTPGTIEYFLKGWFNEFGTAEFDLGALSEGHVVLTPLHFDMTDHARLDAVKSCDWPDLS